MTARDEILGNVRRSLNRREPLSPPARVALEERITAHRVNVQPRVSGDSDELVERFIAKVEAVSGTVTRIPGLQSISQAVEGYLHRHDLPYEVVMAGDPLLKHIAWPQNLRIDYRAARGEDRTSITTAFAAVAETGTLVLTSAKETPTTLNFLPEDHIVVLRREQIVRHLEDAWTKLRREHADMPRSVNCITGPSRTGDVEQTIQLGAHGPRRLHVILVEE